MANNFDDPLYIHPCDTRGMNLVNEQLIGVENYGIWSRAMLIALRAKNKLAMIDGSYSRPAIGSPTLRQWERCNALVLSWIMNTVSKEIFGGIVYASDASTVWADLKEQFDKINGSRIFSLHREIGRLTQGNTTISNYYCKLKQLWDEYSALVTLPSCECDTAKKYLEHEQQQRLLQFLMGLNDSYMNVRSQILMMNPLPTVGQAFSLLSQEESHRTLSTTDNQVAAFYTKQSKNDNSAKEVTCEYCHWNGHTKADCYRLIGYPPGHRLYKIPNKGPNKKMMYRDNLRNKKASAGSNMVEGNVSEGTSSNAVQNAPLFTSAQYAEILKLLGNTSVQSEGTPTVNMAGTDSKAVISEWIIDTGANEHMIGDLSLLQRSTSLVDSTSTVRLPNGSKVSISKVGSTFLSESIELQNVLYVPHFQFNILSVSKFTKAHGCFVTFYPDFCIFQDLKTRRVMGIGKERQGLYHFTTKTIQETNFRDIVTLSSHMFQCNNFQSRSTNNVPCKSVDINTWHKILGHMSITRMQLLPFVSKNDSISHCSICPISKQSRLPFPHASETKYFYHFQVIHMDIWGPFHTPTYNGERYFLTIVDDYSRGTWVYL
ncbi:hypothetical protein F511_19803 [Dorcoceras hygrometricum]|uniref:Retrotransposon Copia-like N-terminal domain-containing protein n=1 Tax=Dorcoceras hygrometricum TaxID=472368 RepID=A0A2Z7AVB0_9LAMI|nr:hypothetical protein F511_19803 [Dorcoceras hygrometricum]